MSPSITIKLNGQDLEQYLGFLEALGRRSARSELLPILKEHFEPVVAEERRIVNPHSKSGALETSLVARSGPGDRPGVISVFSAPAATTKQLQSTWGRGRKQQQGWAAGLKKKSKYRKVFYGTIVHQGHRIVKRNAQGTLYDTGDTADPIPFAQQAMDAKGEQNARAAEAAILNHIWGE